MAESINPAFLEPGTLPIQPELLVSAVLHLMSHYTVNVTETGTCIKLASVIERHLKALANLPDLAPVLRATCQQLSEQWATVVELRTCLDKAASSSMFQYRALAACKGCP